MTLLQTHLKYLETKDYWTKRSEDIISKIKMDESGAFWHQDETFERMRRTSQELDGLPKFTSHLSGLAVGVKDLFCIKGMRTTSGSAILKDFISPYDSTVWSSIQSHGGFLSGKLSMDEFAMGSFTNTSPFGKTSIPLFPERTAGGSSGGSGAAVASGIVDFSIGSDTGGSVRLPASFCGIVGYKPSYGAFSRYGMISYASSLDQAGFLTRTIDDMDYLMQCQDLYEKDAKDMTCIGLKAPKEFKEIESVGYFPDILDSPGISPDVAQAYKETLDKLRSDEIVLKPIEIPYMKYAAQIYYIIACSEASSNLSRYQGVYFGQKVVDEKYNMKQSYGETIAQYRSKYFGAEVQRRIMLGSFILSAENFTAMYQKAWSLRKALTAQISHALQTVDTLVLPVFPSVAPKWNEIDDMTPAQVYLADFMTVPFSLAGVCALSLPWFKDKEGLDIGMQWIGSKMNDLQHIKRLQLLTHRFGMTQAIEIKG